MLSSDSQAVSLDSPRYRIGEAARVSGLTTANIRYYEREGLVLPALRLDNGYRLYSAKDVQLLRLIRLCRSMDMSLDEVRRLLSLQLDSPDGCEQARRVLDGHLAEVQARLHELGLLEQSLQALRPVCDSRQNEWPRGPLVDVLHQRLSKLDERADAPETH